MFQPPAAAQGLESGMAARGKGRAAALRALEWGRYRMRVSATARRRPLQVGSAGARNPSGGGHLRPSASPPLARAGKTVGDDLPDRFPFLSSSSGRRSPPRRSRRGLQAFAAIALAALGAAAPLAAQFGSAAETANFRIVAGPEMQLEPGVLAAAAAHLENVRSRLAAIGLKPRRQPAGEPLEILLTPTVVSMRALTGGVSGLRTRGLTVQGLDRNMVLLAWHAPGDPLKALAHEYAHQLDESAWPLWFVEGRCEFLSRYPSRTAPMHLALLRRAERVGLPALLAAEAAGAASPPGAFYAESWLVFAWLAERRGAVASIRPEHLRAAIDELGTAGVEAELQQYAERLAAELEGEQPVAQALDVPATVRGLEPWERPLLEAEIDVALRRRERASALLTALLRGRPEVARVHAARGLAAIVEQDYDQAEASFARAIALGDRRAATAYRYTLMLMRPGGDAGWRAAEAMEHSLRARRLAPAEPRYRLAAAQACMLAGEWERAFAELHRLAEFPGWAERAAREAAEVRRRRNRRLAAQAPPRLALQSAQAADYWPRHPDPQPLPAPPPKPRKPAAGAAWPPPGTTLAYGRIGWVDCSGGERKIVLSTPRLRLVLRENPARPPRLIFPPVKWKALPCGTYGWTVNIAYKPLRGAGEIKGEAVAVLF